MGNGIDFQISKIMGWVDIPNGGMGRWILFIFKSLSKPFEILSKFLYLLEESNKCYKISLWCYVGNAN